MRTIVAGIWICLFMLPDLVCQAQDLLFPFGVENGDSVMPKVDDGFEEVSLDFEFPFFDRNHRELFLNTNGVISFLKEVTQYTPDVFPLGDGRRLIAPFWADVDSSVAGDIFYREDRSQPILDLVDRNIQRAFPVNFARFASSWVFIATWEEVAFYNNRGGQLRPINNTFQAVLASDGLHSFTIFNYEKIEWTTGLSSYGDKNTGSANSQFSVAGQVGFNAGDGVTYFAVEGSRTQSVKNVTLMSNVDIPGRWVFRIDNAEIESAGCRDISEAEIQISPSEVRMLGGDILALSGPCFDSSHNVFCRFDGILTQARYNLALDPFTVQCATPAFMRLGRVLVELSLDGGVTFENNVTVSIVPLDNQPGLVAVRRENELSKRISWQDENSPFDLTKDTITNVDIILYGYKEDGERNLVELLPIKFLKRNIRLSNKDEVVDSSQLQERNFDVGIIRLTERGKVNLKNDVYRWTSAEEVQSSSELVQQPEPIPSLWSLPFNTNPSSATSARLWCSSWTKSADHVILTSSDPAVDCPCRMDQALKDVGRFELYPRCEGSQVDDGDDCMYRTEAQRCFRAKYGSQNLGRGQLCCYGNNGHLVDLRDTTSGGSVQSRHHFGFRPDYHVGNIPYLSNFLHDIIPWEECCGKTGKLNVCKLYSDRRPPSDCKAYQLPGLGSIFGEPHLQTWDNHSFTFNGYGEYHLVEMQQKQIDRAFRMQGRMEEVFMGSGATGLTAVVAEAYMSDKVQIELNQRRDVDIWVYHKDEGKWALPDFTTSNYYVANGVAVEIFGTDSQDQSRIGALVTFSEGSSYQVKLPESGQSLNLLVNLSPYLKGAVWGLLGTWDGDTSNEFTLPDGSSPSDDISSAVHNHLLEWRIAESDTLFRYTNGRSAAIYREASDSFIPNYDVGKGNITEAEISDICDNSTVCRFDFLKTRDPLQGRNTKTAEEEEKQRRRDLIQVIGCGYIPPPNNGYKEGEIYLVGHTVTFVCDGDFVLRGSSRRTCEEQGQWSGNVTTCIPREELDTEDDLLLFVVIGVSAALILSLLVFCLLLFCCVVSRKKNIREKEKILKSAYQLEVSVISNDLSVADEANSYNNHSPAANGHIPANRQLSANGHIPHGKGPVSQRNSEVPHANGHMTAGRRSPPETIDYANQMSFAEHQTENISQALVRKQEVPSGRQGSVQSMPSHNRPSTSKIQHGDDSVPALSCRPKTPVRSNEYGSLPVRNVNYDSLPEGGKLSPKFQNLSNADESDDDEVTRIKRIIKEDAGRI